MNLQLYAKNAKPEKLSAEELAFMRAQANKFLDSSDQQKVNVGRTINVLLDHIDLIPSKKLTGQEINFMRSIAQHFIKQGDAIRVQVGRTMSMLLDHIDYMTLEAMRNENPTGAC